MSYIFIHEKFYDLDKLKKSHPGGNLKIFEAIENEEDCTALFESSHAMLDIKKIYGMMKIYELKTENYAEYGITEEVIQTKSKSKKFNFENYHKLSQIVKNKLGVDYKASYFWYFKALIIVCLHIFLFYNGVISNQYSIYHRLFFSFFAGFLVMTMYLCIMHDASHYALFDSKSNNFILNNDFLNSLFHGWGILNSFIWLKHHIYGHHSFTGIYKDDPDTIHWEPFIMKDITKTTSNTKIFAKVQHKLFLVFMLLMPGMYSGQIYAYFVGGLDGSCFGLKVKNAFLKIPNFEKILFIFSVSLIIFFSNFWSVFFLSLGNEF